MASFIDSLVADIRKVPLEGDYKELSSRLNQREEQLSKLDISLLDTMMECLDASVHSLGMQAAL